ncbi:MAG: hypothetical protein HQM05_15090 [Magnetococcales bacterium]|nr:hypothetical protein [Magnetococcales bacterium]
MERPTARQSAWQWQERIGIRDRKTLDGDQSLFFNRLMDLGDPLEDFDAVNKKYVDDVFGDGEIIVVIGSVDDIADLDLDPGSIAGSDADAVMAVHLAMYDHTLIGSGVDLTEHLAAYDHTNIHPSNIIDGDTVDVSGRDTGDVLTWNGAMWVPAPPSSRWRLEEGTYVATPASTSTITTLISRSGVIPIGTPIAYKIGGVYYFGIVRNITPDTITVAGAPLSGDIQRLLLGVAEQVGQADYVIPGVFSAIAEDELIKTFQKSHSFWRGKPAYLVHISHIVQALDSTVQPNVNVLINGNAVGTDNANTGLPVALVVQSTGIGINPSNYRIEYGDVIELETTAGGTGNASDLTAFLTFISES